MALISISVSDKTIIKKQYNLIDDFNRSDGLLQNGWTSPVPAFFDDCRIVGNLVRPRAAPPAAGDVIMQNEFFTVGPDQWAELTVVTATLAASVGPCVRVDIASANFYCWAASGSDVYMFKTVAGVFFGLGPALIPGVFTNGDKLRIEAVGNNIRGYINNVLILSVFDNSIATGKLGFECYSNDFTTSAQLDNFVGGSFIAGVDDAFGILMNPAQFLHAWNDIKTHHEEFLHTWTVISFSTIIKFLHTWNVKDSIFKQMHTWNVVPASIAANFGLNIQRPVFVVHDSLQINVADDLDPTEQTSFRGLSIAIRANDSISVVESVKQSMPRRPIVSESILVTDAVRILMSPLRATLSDTTTTGEQITVNIV